MFWIKNWIYVTTTSFVENYIHFDISDRLHTNNSLTSS